MVQSRSARLASRKSDASSKSDEASESKGDESDRSSDQRRMQKATITERNNGTDEKGGDHVKLGSQSGEKEDDNSFEDAKTGVVVADPLESKGNPSYLPSSPGGKVSVARRTRRSKNQTLESKVEAKRILSSRNSREKLLPSKPARQSSSAVETKMKSIKSYFVPIDERKNDATHPSSARPSERKHHHGSDQSDGAFDDCMSENSQIEERCRPPSSESVFVKIDTERKGSDEMESNDIESSSQDFSQMTPKTGVKRKRQEPTTKDFFSLGQENDTKQHEHIRPLSKDSDNSIIRDNSNMAEIGTCPLGNSSSNRNIEGVRASENSGREESNCESITSLNSEPIKTEPLEMEITTEMSTKRADAPKSLYNLRAEERIISKAGDQEMFPEFFSNGKENFQVSSDSQLSSFRKGKNEDHDFEATEICPTISSATQSVLPQTPRVLEEQSEIECDAISGFDSDEAKNIPQSTAIANIVHETEGAIIRPTELSEPAEGAQQVVDILFTSNRKDDLAMSSIPRNETGDKCVPSILSDAAVSRAVGEHHQLVDPGRRHKTSSPTFENEDIPNEDISNHLKIKLRGGEDKKSNAKATDISNQRDITYGHAAQVDAVVFNDYEKQPCRGLNGDKGSPAEPATDHISLTVNGGLHIIADTVPDTSLPASTDLSSIKNLSSNEFDGSTVSVLAELESMALKTGESVDNTKDGQSILETETIELSDSHDNSTQRIDSLDAGPSPNSQIATVERSQRPIYGESADWSITRVGDSTSSFGRKKIDTVKQTNITTEQLQSEQTKEFDDSQNRLGLTKEIVSDRGDTVTTVIEKSEVGGLNTRNFGLETRKKKTYSSISFHLPSLNKHSQILESSASIDQEKSYNPHVCSAQYGVSVAYTSENKISGASDQDEEKTWNASRQLERRSEPDCNQQPDRCCSSLNFAKQQLNDSAFNCEKTLNFSSSATNTLGDDAIGRSDHNSSDKIHESLPPEVMQSYKKRRTFSVGQLKMALFLESSKTHNGLGAQRIFANYLEALEKFITLGSQEGSDSAICNKAASSCSGIQATLKSFLKTRKMKCLHNKLILAIMSESLRSIVPLQTTIPHLPEHWKKATKIHLIPCEQLDANNEGIVQDKSRDRGHGKYDWKDIVRDREFCLREWNFNFGPISGAWMRFGNELNISKSYLPGFDVNDAACDNLRVCSTSDEIIPSARLPGALEIDPFVRKMAQQTALTVSENAIWLLIVAVREHSKAVITETISSCKNLDKGFASELPKSFMNSIAHTCDAPVRDSIQKPPNDNAIDVMNSTETRKMAVINASDLSVALVANPVLVGGIRSSSRLAYTPNLSRFPIQVAHNLDQVNCVINAAIERTASNWQRKSGGVTTDPLQPDMEVLNLNRSKASTKASAPRAKSKQPTASSQIKESKKSRSGTSSALVSFASISGHNEKSPVKVEKKEVESGPTSLLNAVTPKLLQLEQGLSDHLKEEKTTSSDSKGMKNEARRSLPEPMKKTSVQRRGSKNLAALMARSTSRPQSTSDDKTSILVESSSQNKTNDSSHMISVSKSSGPEKGNDNDEAKPTTCNPNPPARPRGRGFGVKNLAAMRARSSVNESVESGK